MKIRNIMKVFMVLLVVVQQSFAMQPHEQQEGKRFTDVTRVLKRPFNRKVKFPGVKDQKWVKACPPKAQITVEDVFGIFSDQAKLELLTGPLIFQYLSMVNDFKKDCFNEAMRYVIRNEIVVKKMKDYKCFIVDLFSDKEQLKNLEGADIESYLQILKNFCSKSIFDDATFKLSQSSQDQLKCDAFFVSSSAFCHSSGEVTESVAMEFYNIIKINFVDKSGDIKDLIKQLKDFKTNYPGSYVYIIGVLSSSHQDLWNRIIELAKNGYEIASDDFMYIPKSWGEVGRLSDV